MMTETQCGRSHDGLSFSLRREGPPWPVTGVDLRNMLSEEAGHRRLYPTFFFRGAPDYDTVAGAVTFFWDV